MTNLIPSAIDQKVMYAEIIDASDAETIFTVIEIDAAANWCRIRANVNMNIKPTYTANLTDLKVIA